MHRAPYVVLAALVMLVCVVASAAARQRVPFPVGVTITVGPCPHDHAALGCTYSDREALAAGAYGDLCRNRRGCIYLPDPADKFNLYHELAHAWESQHLTEADRWWYARRMGRPRDPWRVGSGRHPSPEESFADIYANCAIGNGRGRRWDLWETAYGVWIGRRRYAGICNGLSILAQLQDRATAAAWPAGTRD